MTAEVETNAPTIDVLSVRDALTVMQTSHAAAVMAITSARADLATAARVVAETLEKRATLHYAAAGSSGLMALADACELPGTFGIPQSQIKIHMAGGIPTDGSMPGDTEDSTSDAIRDAKGIAPFDTVIVISASGTTPYALAFAKAARQSRVSVIAITNTPDAELLTHADVSIVMPTAPEVLSGSSRLGAGTAQKVALNMISTQAGVLMGHVHDGMMVNLQPDNIKLRDRATHIVTQIGQVPSDRAAKALEATQYHTKAATLVSRGLTTDDAFALLERNKGHLRACLSDLEETTTN